MLSLTRIFNNHALKTSLLNVRSSLGAALGAIKFLTIFAMLFPIPYTTWMFNERAQGHFVVKLL
jgi:hypothetical protein